MSKSQNNKFLTHETTLLPNRIERKGVVYQNRFQKIEKVVAKFEGFSKEYFVLNPGQRAAVVAVRDDKILAISGFLNSKIVYNIMPVVNLHSF